MNERDQLLQQQVAVAAERALPVLSGFRVGAAALGVSGAIYPGCNIEFEGLPLSDTIHAEQCAIANAAAHGEKGIVRIAVSAAPCGYCRQFLFELSTAAELHILLPGTAPQRFTEFLPAPFGPRDLGIEGGLLDSAPHPLELDGEHTDISLAALKAARRAYAPYTKAAAGVALKTRSGKICTGYSMENAAYNPTMAPMQAAIAAAVAQGVRASGIVEAVVVESSASRLGYTAAARRLLAQFCPGVTLRELSAQPAASSFGT